MTPVQNKTLFSNENESGNLMTGKWKAMMQMNILYNISNIFRMILMRNIEKFEKSCGREMKG